MNYFLSSTFYGTLKVSSITLPVLNTNIFSGFFDCDATSRFREDALFDKKVLLKENNTQVDVLQEINQLKSNLTTNNSTTEFTNDVTFQGDILLFNSSYLDETQTIITPPPTSLRQRLYDINSQLGDVTQEVSNALLETENLSTFISTIDKTYVGLSEVDNTSDLNKPISLATETALNQKVDSSTLTTLLSTKANLSDLQQINKTSLGLENVDNTSDLNKPTSLATQTALNLKADKTSVVDLTSSQTILGTKTFSNVTGTGRITYEAAQIRRLEMSNIVFSSSTSFSFPNDSSVIFITNQTNNDLILTFGSIGTTRVGSLYKIRIAKNSGAGSVVFRTGLCSITRKNGEVIPQSTTSNIASYFLNESGIYIEAIYTTSNSVVLLNETEISTTSLNQLLTQVNTLSSNLTNTQNEIDSIETNLINNYETKTINENKYARKINLEDLVLRVNNHDQDIINIGTNIATNYDDRITSELKYASDMQFQDLVSRVDNHDQDISNFQAQIDAIPTFQDFAAFIYPVGSLYFSASDTRNPFVIFGFGTWEQIQGRFIRSIDTGETLATTGGNSSHSHLWYKRADGPSVNFPNALIGKSNVGTMQGHSYDQNGNEKEIGTYIVNGAEVIDSDFGTSSSSSLPPFYNIILWRRTN